MVFDIRDEDKAIQTLVSLTGVEKRYWIAEKKRNQRRDYTDECGDIKRVIEDNNGHFPKLEEIEIIITHITTSNNECLIIKEKGLVNLKKSYSLEDSDLRKFLDEIEVFIDVDSHTLKYKGKSFDISFDKCPSNYESIEYKKWLIGRKLYYDFAVCGFLTISESDIYGGNVHIRPEFLNDIDNLLGTTLSLKWSKSHLPYEIVFTAPADEVVYGGCSENDDETEKVLYYLSYAYEVMNGLVYTKDIICKNDTDILPRNIIEINKFEKWKTIYESYTYCGA